MRKIRPGEKTDDDDDEDLQIPAAPKRFVVTEDRSTGGVCAPPAVLPSFHHCNTPRSTQNGGKSKASCDLGR
jgi:hypothetical protein